MIGDNIRTKRLCFNITNASRVYFSSQSEHMRMVGPFRTGQNFTDVSQGGYEKPSEDIIMLPKMPQGKFHTDIWSTELDVKDGYTKCYIDALDSARLLAIEQLSEDFWSVFEFQGSRIPVCMVVNN